jgi:hypothetical protein
LILEFDTVKIGVAELLPNSQKFHGKTGAHPVLNDKPGIVGISFGFDNRKLTRQRGL